MDALANPKRVESCDQCYGIRRIGRDRVGIGVNAIHGEGFISSRVSVSCWGETIHREAYMCSKERDAS